jgi:hypothetical protein
VAIEIQSNSFWSGRIGGGEAAKRLRIPTSELHSIYPS